MPDNWDFSQQRGRGVAAKTSGAPIPLLTYALIAFSIVITLASMYADSSSSLPFLHKLGAFGYATPDQIWSGRYYALFTTVFIHGSWMHLIFNMLWLYRLGLILEESLHPFTYLLFVLVAAAVGSGAELATSGQTGIGMSGVVYAMFGLMWAGRGRFPAWRSIATRDNLNYFIFWGVLCFFATEFNWFHIANAAHGGGFLFGLSTGYLFFAPRRQPIWGLCLAALLALTVIACTWMPWSARWTSWKGDLAFQRKDYPAAIAWLQRSIRHLPRGDEDETRLWYNISAAWHNIAYEAEKRHDEAVVNAAIIQEQAALQKSGTHASTPQDQPDDTNAGLPSSPEELGQKATQNSAPTK